MDDGHVIKPFGLHKLVELAMEIVPEAQKEAFVAAQKVSIRQKKINLTLLFLLQLQLPLVRGQFQFHFQTLWH